MKKHLSICLLLLFAGPAASQPPAPPKAKCVDEEVSVFVARCNLPFGLLIKDPDQHFQKKVFARDELPAKAVNSAEQLKDRRLIRALTAGQVVTVDVLLAVENRLDALLPPGMRACAIKVSPESLHGGFILPQSRVDVIWTVKGKDDLRSQTLLENILVLAVDSAANRPGEDDALLGNTVTLAVTPEQAEKLTKAAAEGEFRLVLRPVGDGKLAPPPKEEVARTLVEQGDPAKKMVPWAKIPEGHRAYGIRCQEYGGSIIMPYHRVNVVLDEHAEGQATKPQTVVECVLVVAVDNVMIKQEHVHIVTVAVTPEQAEKLDTAESLGEVRLILHAFGEKEPVRSKGKSAEEIFGSKAKHEQEEKKDRQSPE
jgi:pilus assembly protein CpaB